MPIKSRSSERARLTAGRKKPASPSFVMDDAILTTIGASGEPENGRSWDTIAKSRAWQLGVVRQGKLLNRTDSCIPIVPINTTMGGVRFFAADSGYFKSGQNFRITMLTPEDTLLGVTASPGSGRTYVPTMAMTYLGTTGEDRVGKGETALAPDGMPDGVIRLRIAPGKRPFTITGMRLRASDEQGAIIPSIAWDTMPGNGTWILGVYKKNKSRQSVQLNMPDGSLKTRIKSPTDLYIHFSSPTDTDFFSTFPLFKLTINIGRSRSIDIGTPADAGSSASNPRLAFEYERMTEDMVRPGKNGLGSDGKPDGEFRLTIL